MNKLCYRAGLLAGVLAVLAVAGLGANALAQNEQPKPADKKPQPPAVPNLFGDIDDILKDLPDGVDKDQLKKLLEMQKEMLKNFPQNGFGGGFQFPGGRFGMARSEEGRFGVRASTPSDTLVDQL